MIMGSWIHGAQGSGEHGQVSFGDEAAIKEPLAWRLSRVQLLALPPQHEAFAFGMHAKRLAGHLAGDVKRRLRLEHLRQRRLVT
jgi:hypothetical protein